MKDLNKYSEKTFEDIKHIDEFGNEYWEARELQITLEYTQWRNFEKVIQKAIISAENSNNSDEVWLAEVSKPIITGKGKEETIKDYKLSRYICYLIVQNGDPRKEVIALGQTYFAVKTRQQELVDNYDQLSEEQKRLAIRSEMISHNKSLAEAARKAGVETSLDYALFQNKGYEGLYGGLLQKDIHRKKGLKKNQKILDHMGSTELAANLFRATQTDEKLRRDNIQGKENANQVHFDVGSKVRETIKEIGGTMPEDMPTPEESIAQIEHKVKKKEIKNKE